MYIIKFFSIRLFSNGFKISLILLIKYFPFSKSKKQKAKSKKQKAKSKKQKAKKLKLAKDTKLVSSWLYLLLSNCH
jgi:hypothetical protein